MHKKTFWCQNISFLGSKCIVTQLTQEKNKMGCFVALLAGAILVMAHAFAFAFVGAIICELWPWILGLIILSAVLGSLSGK